VRRQYEAGTPGEVAADLDGAKAAARLRESGHVSGTARVGFQGQEPPRLENPLRANDDVSRDSQAVVGAAESRGGLPVTNETRELPHLTKGDVGRIGHDQARTHVADRGEPRTVRELNGGAKGGSERVSVRPRDTKGIVEDTTVTARVNDYLGRATSTPDQPAPGRIAELQWATATADALLAEIERFYTSEVRAYRDAVRAVGFELLGG